MTKEEYAKKLTLKNLTGKNKNDLLQGVTLAKILETLVQRIGWQKMGEAVNIKCFTDKPTITSSLRFLRSMSWAREKVEQLYIETVIK